MDAFASQVTTDVVYKSPNKNPPMQKSHPWQVMPAMLPRKVVSLASPHSRDTGETTVRTVATAFINDVRTVPIAIRIDVS
jgi:hypothetical protein